MCLNHIVPFCSAVFCNRLKRGRSFGSCYWLLLVGAMGPRCACEVRKWWFGAMMSTDATEDDMDLLQSGGLVLDGHGGRLHINPARTEEAGLDPPECPGIAEVKRCTWDSRSA